MAGAAPDDATAVASPLELVVLLVTDDESLSLQPTTKLDNPARTIDIANLRIVMIPNPYSIVSGNRMSESAEPFQQIACCRIIDCLAAESYQFRATAALRNG